MYVLWGSADAAGAWTCIYADHGLRDQQGASCFLYSRDWGGKPEGKLGRNAE